MRPVEAPGYPVSVRAAVSPVARRVPGLVAVLGAALSLAMVVAACGSDRSADDVDDNAAGDPASGDPTASPADGAADGQSDHAATGGVDLGRLEAGFGLGSEASVVLDRLGDNDALAGEWFRFEPVFETVPACHFGDPLASVHRNYLNRRTGESAGFVIQLHPDPASASAAVTTATGEGYGACARAAKERLDETIRAQGVFERLDADLEGRIEPSLLADPDGATRRTTLELSGPGSSLTLDVATTYLARGRALVVVEVALLDGSTDHGDLTARLVDLLGDDAVGPAADPALDLAAERMRHAVLGPDSPARFYQLLEPAMLAAGGGPECGGPAHGRLRLVGPTWATAQRVSAISQQTDSYATEAEAVAAFDALSSIDSACVHGELAADMAGTVTFVEATDGLTERDGRTVFTATVRITQRLDGPNDIEVEARSMLVATRVGTELVGWQFLGIEGDEPDLVGLTVAAAERLEAGL